MADYVRRRIDSLISIGLDKTLTTQERGQSLEELFSYLLCELPGIAVIRNARDVFKSMEIDIAVANAHEARWLRMYPKIFLVECKNWDERVGAEAVSRFSQKLENCYVEAGILVAANGITGDQESLTSAYHTVAMAQTRGRRIIVVTLEQLSKLHATDDLEILLRDQYLRLVVSGQF